ncbi:MAG: hypothetical protein E7575_01965 [Ruminococcaceae bacterium]|nr:hypothetical protein [Oscillospiraceae bacterium]
MVGESKEMHPLLRRAIHFLEEGNWASADDYCERVLDMEPENAYAYVIKLMARVRVCRETDLVNAKTSFREWNSFNNALRFADETLKARLLTYLSGAEDGIEERERLRLEKEAEEQKRAQEEENERTYLKGLNYQDEGTVETLKLAIRFYEGLGDYKDCAERLRFCRERLELKQEEQKKRQLERLKEEEKAKKKKVIVRCVILVLLVAFAVIICVTINTQNEKKANKIERNFAGMSFEASYMNVLDKTSGGTIESVTEMTQTQDEYTFADDGSAILHTIVYYDKEPFLTKNGERQWDDVSSRTSNVRWGNVKVSFFGKITVEIDGDVCELEVDSQNRPVSIKIGKVKYKCK